MRTFSISLVALVTTALLPAVGGADAGAPLSLVSPDRPDLKLSMIREPATLSPIGDVTYRLIFLNQSQLPLRDITITEVVEADEDLAFRPRMDARLSPRVIAKESDEEKTTFQFSIPDLAPQGQAVVEVAGSFYDKNGRQGVPDSKEISYQLKKYYFTAADFVSVRILPSESPVVPVYPELAGELIISVSPPASQAPVVVRSIPDPFIEGVSSALVVDHFAPASASGVLQVRQYALSTVRKDRPTEYRIEVVNTSTIAVENVEIIADTQSNFEISEVEGTGLAEEFMSEANHDYERLGDELQWRFKRFPGQGRFLVTLFGTPRGDGALELCATVRTTTDLCLAPEIVSPRLEISRECPPEVILCDDVPVRITVRNTGNGVAEDVLVSDQVGDMRSEWRVGHVPPGGEKSVEYRAASSRPGMMDGTATAVEQAGTELVSARSATRVTVPVLMLAKRAPAMRYLGTEAAFEIEVCNQGDAVALDTRIEDPVPAGARNIRLSPDGRIEGNRAVWAIGDLAPGERRTVSMTATLTQIGTLHAVTQATAYCAQSETECVVRVEGVPAVLVEVVDIDPIEVGSIGQYRILIKNQGSADVTGVATTVILPNELSWIEARAPRGGSVSRGQRDGEYHFSALGRLAPQESVEYLVRVRGERAGDVRFTTEVRVNEFDPGAPPVIETEATRVY